MRPVVVRQFSNVRSKELGGLGLRVSIGNWPSDEILLTMSQSWSTDKALQARTECIRHKWRVDCGL